MTLSPVPFSVEIPTAKPAVSLSLEDDRAVVVLDTLIIGEDRDPQQNATVPQAGTVGSNADVTRLMDLAREAHIAGDLKRLRIHLNKILEIDPDHAQAHFNLGVLDRDRGAHPEAEAHFRRAVKISPRNTQYHMALGELMHVMRHLLFAAEVYEAGLAIDPNNVAMLTNLTEIRQKQRMPREVAALSRRSLALDPQSVPATESLAWALLWLGETEEALEAAERAHGLDAKSLPAIVMMQIALARLGEKERAAAILAEIEQRALILWDDCAVIVERYTQFDERDMAERILRNVIEKRPNFVPALLQLGRYMILKSDLEEGFKLMSRVVELNPDEGDAQTSVSLTMIRNGDYEAGWARHHWRWKRTGCEPRWDLALPEWDGTDLGDGGVIVWREQGIGDMIMYAAPAMSCRALAGKVAIETNPRLQPLLQRSFPDMSIVCREALPENFLAENNIVAQCPIGDLPHLLKLDMANYPGRDGFLVPDPTEIARLRGNYQLLFPGKRLVGISWRSGNASSAVTRSIELSRWKPIFATEGCVFISLQYGDVSKEVEELGREHGVDVYIDSNINAMTDMDNFAAQIAAMDVVISVDNSTVHVAGALGKTTWALIPAASDWRWLTPDRTDTIWYRSVTLLRQKPGTDWLPQIEDAAARLSELRPEAITEERIGFYLRCARQSIEAANINVGERFYRQVLQLHPDHHAALAGVGQVALQSGYVADAVSLLRRAVEAAPEQIDYQASLIEALSAAGRHDQAYGVLRNAMKIDGQNIRVLTAGIRVLSSLGKDEETANYCARLLRLMPDNREARLHLARMQIAAGDFDVAEANLTRLLETRPDDAVAGFTLGCLAFRNEQLAEGWSGYALRFDAGATNPAAPLPLPVLKAAKLAADLKQERIAVRPEASLKDQILFARWLTQLRRDSGFLVGELDPRLIPLVDQTATRLSLFPTGSLQAEEAEDLQLTSQVALGDLGARYGRDLASLGAAVPYLQFDRAKAAAMRRDYLAALNAKRLIGLCWRGGDLAVPLSEWLPVLQSADFGFVSLQAGPAQQELHEVFDSLGKMAVRDPSIDPQTNLRGFAAQIAAVDLVIAIDEVPAHLAGALAVPVFCLLARVADWRWFGADRMDSPWYPSMRLYRQTADGNWADVMAKISSDLIALVEAEGAEQ